MSGCNVVSVSDPSVTDEVRAWFMGRTPERWFVAPLEVRVDREEILVVGEVAGPDLDPGTPPSVAAAARRGRIERFREETREARTRIARDAEHLFGRKVSWGAACGGERFVFTNVSVPVMTRLRMPEREVLDTLVDASVARSRSEALAWCVRLVGAHEGEWIAELRDALVHVQKVRAQGPASG